MEQPWQLETSEHRQRIRNSNRWIGVKLPLNYAVKFNFTFVIEVVYLH